jgi:hypothetical protein
VAPLLPEHDLEKWKPVFGKIVLNDVATLLQGPSLLTMPALHEYFPKLTNVFDFDK